MDALKNVHLTYMFEDIVFFSNFPKNIRLNSENKLILADILQKKLVSADM